MIVIGCLWYGAYLAAVLAKLSSTAEHVVRGRGRRTVVYAVGGRDARRERATAGRIRANLIFIIIISIVEVVVVFGIVASCGGRLRRLGKDRRNGSDRIFTLIKQWISLLCFFVVVVDFYGNYRLSYLSAVRCVIVAAEGFVKNNRFFDATLSTCPGQPHCSGLRCGRRCCCCCCCSSSYCYRRIHSF